MSKQYIITDVAEDGTITARPTDNTPLYRWKFPPPGFDLGAEPGQVIRAELIGIEYVLSSTKGSDATTEDETGAGMG